MIDLDETRPPSVAPTPPPARAPGQPPRPGARARFVTAVATILCAGVIAYYVSPLWQRLDTWGGTFDWGYFFFMAEVDRKTVVEFGQFPLWNPYYCGGSVHLANPQTYFLSPTFLFIWAFGTPIGLRLMITAAIVMAADGMRRFLGSLGVGTVGALVGGTGYAVSGAIAQHLGGGHVAWLGFCVLPYVLHSFNRAFSGQRRHILYGGLFLAWIFGHFGGYSYPYAALTLGVWGIFWSASAGRLGRGIAEIVWMVGLSLGLCAVRLLPILEFMRGHPRIRPDVDIVSPLEFGEIYAAHHRARGAAGHPYVWPEYGNYLGVAAIALMAVGIWTVGWRRKAVRPLLTSMLVFVAFQIGNVPGFPWWLVKHLPIFHFMRAPSRFTTVVGLFACALAGLAVDRLQDPLAHARAASGRDGADAREGAGAGARAREGWLGTLVIALLALVFLIDAARFNREQWLQTLTTPPPADPVAPAFRQERGNRRRMYAYPRTNQGTIDCFEETPVDISSRLRGGLAADEYPLDATAGTVRRVSWTPNSITVETDFRKPGVVVVNQNFHAGWRVRGGQVMSQGGLLAARVGAGRHVVSFRFLPGSFLLGLGLSLAVLGWGIWLWIRWGPRRSMDAPGHA